MKTLIKLFIPALFILASACKGTAEKSNNTEFMEFKEKKYEYATIGGGCFWCIEAIFMEVRGISKATSGYSGGTVKNPSYREVTSGRTGHAEVVQLEFDPEIISYKDILEIFFHLHDPTTLNRQGADVGTQYRSVIFYHNDEQEKIARQVFEEIGRSDLWENSLVTEISPLGEFYVAEDYHQNYYANNPNQPYCTFVISPKLSKLRKLFKDRL